MVNNPLTYHSVVLPGRRQVPRCAAREVLLALLLAGVGYLFQLINYEQVDDPHQNCYLFQLINYEQVDDPHQNCYSSQLNQ